MMHECRHRRCGARCSRHVIGRAHRHMSTRPCPSTQKIEHEECAIATPSKVTMIGLAAGQILDRLAANDSRAVKVRQPIEAIERVDTPDGSSGLSQYQVSDRWPGRAGHDARWLFRRHDAAQRPGIGVSSAFDLEHCNRSRQVGCFHAFGSCSRSIGAAFSGEPPRN